jgi:hypothetical protein
MNHLSSDIGKNIEHNTWLVFLLGYLDPNVRQSQRLLLQSKLISERLIVACNEYHLQIPQYHQRVTQKTKVQSYLYLFLVLLRYIHTYIYIYIYIGKEACGSVFGAQKDIGQSKQVSNKSYHGRERQQEKYQDRAFTRC